MTAVEKLTEWVSEEMKNGLQYIHVSVVGSPEPEELAQEVLDAISAKVVENCSL